MHLISKLMDGRFKQISDVYIVKSSKITIGKDKIGTGNFADVYKGVKLRIYHKGKDEILVAVKIVRVGGGNMKQLFLMDTELSCLLELKNEALIMSLHHHRCVIEFFGISFDKIPMILMEYCAGGSLDLHLQKFEDRISTAGIIFLSKLRMIPIRWMAPETLTRTPIYSSKSDIWSFGIVMFEIFNFGQKPWLEKPVKWIATKIRKGITPEMPKRMPRLVREIANACFQFEPDKRPTFKQVNGRILMVQGIRFPPLHPSLLSMAQLKNVKPIKFIEKDPEAITIELDDAKSEEQQPDEFEDAVSNLYNYDLHN
uniref:Protein kinase domain-containing protein n=1 Tax=Onchocerca volvulus TaxID=6282 RepID=A0A8R1U200_ONCVO